MRKRFRLVIHHLAAHPLMLVLPERWGNALDDWTAARAWPESSEAVHGVKTRRELSSASCDCADRERGHEMTASRRSDHAAERSR